MAFGQKKARAGEPQPLATYTVVYRGGLQNLPKAKSGGVTLQLFADHLGLAHTMGSKNFWTDLTVPYPSVREIIIVERQVNTFEALAGGLNSRQLNQKNNIHIA